MMSGSTCMSRELNRATSRVHPEAYQKLDKYKEIVPVQDNLFRYDRGAFWTGRHVFTFRSSISPRSALAL